MEERLKMEAKRIVETLNKGYDIILKRTKEGTLKIMYCRPIKLKGE